MYLAKVLKARQIRKSYGPLPVLKGIDLDVSRGEIVALVGASGAGKSTLLHILGTLDLPDAGSVELNGQRVEGLSEKQLAAFRNKHIGFVFQFHHLLPEFTALENICIPGLIAKRPKKDVESRASALMDTLGISERAAHKPSALSGGEQQRVAVARALINNPDLVMADEPSGNLDSAHARELHQLFFDLRKQLGQTFIIATHNEELAAMSDRKVVMKDGLLG